MNTTVSTHSIFVFFFLILFCISSVNSQEHISSGNSNVKPRIAFGFDSNVITYADIKDSKAGLIAFLDKAAEDIGFDQTIYIFADIESLVNSMRNNQINAACTSSLNYLYISRMFDVQVCFGPVRIGKKTEKYILVVSGNSMISEIKMLKGKQLLLREADDIGFLYLKTMLLRNKLDPSSTLFSNISFKRSASQAILSVFFGQADACITTDGVYNRMIELNPQVGRQLKVIDSSEEMVPVVYFFRKNYDETLKLKIQEWVINYKNTIRGKQLLNLFQIESITALTDSDLNSVNELLYEYEKLIEND